MVTHARCWLLLTICVGLLAGCTGGTDHPATVAVSGKVTFNGEPVEGASVSFMPKEGGSRAGIGTTDSGGKYQLTTFEENDGAQVGSYAVAISKSKAAPGAQSGGPPKGGPPVDLTQMTREATESEPGEGELPAKYADAKTSELEATVTQGGPNEFNFDLE